MYHGVVHRTCQLVTKNTERISAGVTTLRAPGGATTSARPHRKRRSTHTHTHARANTQGTPRYRMRMRMTPFEYNTTWCTSDGEETPSKPIKAWLLPPQSSTSEGRTWDIPATNKQNPTCRQRTPKHGECDATDGAMHAWPVMGGERERV